jgi:hypothetical protein
VGGLRGTHAFFFFFFESRGTRLRDGQEVEDAAALVVDHDDAQRRDGVLVAEQQQRVGVVHERHVTDEQRHGPLRSRPPPGCLSIRSLQSNADFNRVLKIQYGFQ